MKAIQILLGFCLLFAIQKLNAQMGLGEYELKLQELSWDATKNPNDKERLEAAEEVMVRLKEVLALEGAYSYPFDSVEAISMLRAPDDAFRIFTWQLFVNRDQYRHFGLVQLNDEAKTLIELKDASDDIAYPGRKELEADRWFGALYYNIIVEDSPEGKMYMLMGYDAKGLYTRSKVLDVMQVFEKELTFGAPIFDIKKESAAESRFDNPMVTTRSKYRYIMEYSATTAPSLNWNSELKVIQFDHLIMTGGMYGEGKTYVPDGSYEGFKWNGKKYEHIPKLYHQISERAPMPNPIFNKKSKRKGRGLFGGDEKSRNR